TTQTLTACTCVGSRCQHARRCRLAIVNCYEEEEGLGDKLVTGVQTCALPICGLPDPPPGCVPVWMAGRPSGSQVHLQDRKSGVEGKSVDLGGRRIIKKNT